MLNNVERKRRVVSEEPVDDTGVKLEASPRNYQGGCLRKLVKSSVRAATKLLRVKAQIGNGGRLFRMNTLS
jgi:hypothetical protein